MLFAVVVPMIASASCDISILTDYFYDKPYSAKFCALLDPAEAGVPVSFQAVTPWGVTRTVGPANTNSLGKACALVNWPQGIYSLQAFADDAEECQPVAISILNKDNFCGIQGAGTLRVYHYGVAPNAKWTKDYRVANFALVYRPTSPKMFGIIYYDPDNPLGEVSFTTKTFRTVVSGNLGYQYMRFQGMGMFQQGAAEPVLAYYKVYGDNFPGDNWFSIEIRDLGGLLLYNSDNMHVYNGEVVVELCP